MPRAQSNLAIGSISTTDITSLYTVPSGSIVTVYLTLFNTAATDSVVSVIVNDETTDRTIETLELTSGGGEQKLAALLSTQKLTAGFSVKIQSSNANTINYFLSGSIIT